VWDECIEVPHATKSVWDESHTVPAPMCVRSYLRVDAQNVVALWASITNNIYVGADMKMSRFALAAM